jgi:NAD(P)-dependent dehydrogenase (short-subunit alcohol dehydrogenase family)
MSEKTVVVTGASRGLGASVARAFASENAHVVVCARSEGALGSIAAEIEGNESGTVTAQRADVRDEYDTERLMETAARVSQGGIDVVVANAGVYHGDPGETSLEGESYSAVDDHLRTNGRGVYATIKESVPHLAEGANVLVPSGSVAREARAGFGSYAVSKATAEAVARGFAAELDAAVGVLDPGQVETGLGTAGRDPDDIAPMFVWAATDLASDDLNGEIVDLKAWRKATR